jgi:toxin ParE1/3/4
MANLVRTPKADQDLEQIVRFIAKDNLRAAFHWIEEIEALFQVLATQPEIGERWQSRRLGELRRHAFGRYVVYFQPIDGGVEIIRVVHGAREVKRLL